MSFKAKKLAFWMLYSYRDNLQSTSSCEDRELLLAYFSLLLSLPFSLPFFQVNENLWQRVFFFVESINYIPGKNHFLPYRWISEAK